MKRVFIAVAVLAAIAVIIFARPDNKVAERVDELMSSRYAANEPGAAVLIMKGDSIIFEKYYGLADMDSRTPIDSSTTFNIASISKQFTVVGALALQQQNRFDINSIVGDYYPEYTADFWREVTFKHLASQSSGIPDTRDRSSRERMIYANDSVSMSYFPSVKETQFEPGTQYDYVNPTFILIAGAIEKTAGEAFVDYQQKAIFDRCGMSSSYYFNPDAAPSCQSHGYVKGENGWTERDYGEETFFATRPDGGIYSTVRDVAKWERSLAAGEVLADSLVALACKPVVSVSDSPLCDYQRRPNTYYALGWFVDKTPDYPTKVYHTGDNGGYQAYLAKYPSENVVIVVLENRNDHDRWSMALEIDKILKEEGIL